MRGSATATILVVEDNSLDVENLQRGFKRLKIANPIVWAKDGLEALDILRSVDPGKQLSRPHIVLLDLNMPRMNGIEFLKEIREDEWIRDTPVFVLTTSDHQKDVQAAHQLNICGYIVKPLERAQMLETLTMLNTYWTVCELPLERAS